MLDAAFENLKTFDWGSDLATLAPIEEAAIAVHGKNDARQDLEDRLIAALNGELTRDAQDYVCRKLATIGTSAAVPALSRLLANPDHAHMARFALERIPGPEAGQALQDALVKATGIHLVGIISSLGSRRDTAAVVRLGMLLKNADPAVARAAALALGTIGSAESAAVLQLAMQSSTSSLPAIVDALLNCAESLLSSNKQSDAGSIYKRLNHESQPRLVRLAATRGLLACASKQA
jgi:HEAT repeat protein